MDIMTIVGMVLALVAVFGGSVAKGTSLGALWNPAAFIIVILGTIAAISVQSPLSTIRRAIQILPWAFKPPVSDTASLIEKMVEWSQGARRGGLLALEPHIENEHDPFTRKGLQMLVDGGEPASIRNVLEVEMDTMEQSDMRGAKLFEGMGIYAPTLGIIGAVLGLMAVMGHLEDPSKLGPGIAAAFVATIYGIASANLIFLPLANKLKGVIEKQSQTREVIVEGLFGIAEGENPRNLEARLQGYLQ